MRTVLEWLSEIPNKARVECTVRIRRLAELGHELRRPEADLLRGGIHELRASLQGIHYRVLYFFHGAIAAVLAHAIIKEDRVPDRDIEIAVARKALFQGDPERHTAEVELED